MSNGKTVNTFSNIASGVVLIIIAGLALTYEALHKFGFSKGNPEEVLIFLVALLCGAIGVERLLTLRKIEDFAQRASTERETILKKIDVVSRNLETLQSTVKGEFDDVERSEEDLLTAVSKINTAEPLIGTKAIGEAAKAILEVSKDNDNIIATNHSQEDPLGGWGELVADRVAKANLNDGNMEYHLIMPARSDSNSKLEDSRRKIFEEKEIANRLNIKHTKQPWPLDVLIVGSSMIIALKGGSQGATYVAAVRVENAEFVEKASEWYREVGWEKARD